MYRVENAGSPKTNVRRQRIYYLKQFQNATPSQRLREYIQEVEEITARSVNIFPYPDATPDDDIQASLELGPTITEVRIYFRPLLPISDPITEKSVAHELTHALMVYAQGYQIPCAPVDVPTYSVQTATEIVDLIDDIIVDVTIQNLGFLIDAPDHLSALEKDVFTLETAQSRKQIDPFEPDPVRAEIKLVKMYVYSWALSRFITMKPETHDLHRRIVRRFPEIMTEEFSKAREIKKSINSNDIFTLDGRTAIVIASMALWPIDERIYLAAISDAYRLVQFVKGDEKEVS